MGHSVQASTASAPTLPRFCPKCGSHRTEVIGRSNGGKTVALRCNACGEVSAVTQDEEREAGQATGGAELEAIVALDRVLTRLHGEERQRVLRWAAERFGSTAVADSIAAPIAAAALSLQRDDLHDLFAAPAWTPDPTETPDTGDELGDLFDEPADACESIESMEMFESAVEDQAASDEPKKAPGPDAADQPLDVLVADFVSEFRRLAVECERA